MLRFTCPNCCATLSAPEECSGRTSKCRCGATVMVPHAPGCQPPPPASREATALGQMLAHSPTGLASGRLGDNEGSLPGNLPEATVSPENVSKTRVGNVVSHVPTSIAKAPGVASRKPMPASATPSRPRSPSLHETPAPPRQGIRFWIILLLILVPMTIVSATAFAFGLVYFLRVPARRQPSDQQFIKAAQPENLVAQAPTSNDGKLPALPVFNPTKKSDSDDVADVVQQKPSGKKDAKVLLEPGPEKPKYAEKEAKDSNKKDTPAPPFTAEDEKPVPKIEVKPPPEPAVKAKEPPAEQPAKDKVPADIQALIVKLRTGSNEKKVGAAEAIGARGEAASGAARALCEAATSPVKDVSRSALQALEKVAPHLHEYVFTMIVDNQAANHRKAITALRRQEDKAKPCMPIMLFEVKKCLADLVMQFQKGQGSIGWGSDTLMNVISETMNAIPAIAPEDPNGLAIIIEAGALIIQQTDFLGDQFKPFRSTAVPLLGTIAEKQPELRKAISPQLGLFLDQSIQVLGKHSTNSQFKNNPGIIERDLGEIESVGTALQKCGPEAKGILSKKFIPVLKELEFNENAAIRATAKQLRKKVEAGPKDGACVFPATRFLARGEDKRSADSMTAEKAFQMALESREFAGVLRFLYPEGVASQSPGQAKRRPGVVARYFLPRRGFINGPTQS
jgi:hypothetical protein